MKKTAKKKAVSLSPRVRAPRGYYFSIEKTKPYGSYKEPSNVFVSLKLSRNHTNIGRVSLVHHSAGTYATHSRLDNAYHGKGLGAIMYAKAIQWCLDNGYKVRSSGASSDMAVRVWKGSSLRRFFSIRKRNYSYSSYSTWFVLGWKQK